MQKPVNKLNLTGLTMLITEFSWKLPTSLASSHATASRSLISANVSGTRPTPSPHPSDCLISTNQRSFEWHTQHPPRPVTSQSGMQRA